ncbi:taurine ABC transporter permease [Brachyspira hampsonii]|uniref:Taurine ABC transporter permease n=1 Tax=Brachyspira hampsonii TaxID=1287055 RepID=A0A1E5NID9_9SPIR|nr:ABC transporter permease [Brachyspira hampsonii]OEJ15925.1 taurine ABC transporter permease [Brachyspira hampsonii]
MVKKGSKFKDMYLSFFTAVISIVVFIIIWQLAVSFSELGKLMPGPFTVIYEFFYTLVKPIGKYSIIGHVAWSLSRVLIAYVAAAILGITLGVLMGWNRYICAIFDPIYQLIRPIPPIAWIPIAILWFGLGELSKYFLIFLAAFNTITLNAYYGAKSVDRTLIGASKMLGANEIQTLFTVVLPSSVPVIFAGLQVAVSVSWATVVGAEMVRSSEGAGWVIINGQETNNTTQILVGIMAIGIVGYILAIIMRKVEDKLCSWNKNS